MVTRDNRFYSAMPVGNSPILRVLMTTIIIAVATGLALAMVQFRSPAIAFTPIFGAMLAIGALRMPGVVFAAYLYIPFYKGALQPLLPIDITPLLAGTCFALSLPLFFNPTYRVPRVAMTLWLALLGLIMLGAMYAPDRQLATTQALNFLFLVFLPCLLGFLIAQEEHLQAQFLWSTVAVSMLMTIVGLAQLNTIGAYNPLTVLGANTIDVGRAAMLLPVIGFAMSRTATRFVGMVLWGVVPLALLVAFSSGSRGPLLMGPLALIIVNLAHRQGLGRRLAGGAVLLVVILVGAQVPAVQELVPQQSSRRIQTLLAIVLPSDDTAELDNSTAVRIELFKLAGEMLEQRPILGYGTAGFAAVAEWVPGLSGHIYPHNLLLQFAAEYGIIGVALFVALVAVAVRGGLRYMPNRYAMPLLLLAIFAILNSMVSNGLVDIRWLWGSLVILAGIPIRSASASCSANHSVSGSRSGALPDYGEPNCHAGTDFKP